jgi:hypothetical protein
VLEDRLVTACLFCEVLIATYLTIIPIHTVSSNVFSASCSFFLVDILVKLVNMTDLTYLGQGTFKFELGLHQLPECLHGLIHRVLDVVGACSRDCRDAYDAPILADEPEAPELHWNREECCLFTHVSRIHRQSSKRTLDELVSLRSLLQSFSQRVLNLGTLQILLNRLQCSAPKGLAGVQILARYSRSSACIQQNVAILQVLYFGTLGQSLLQRVPSFTSRRDGSLVNHSFGTKGIQSRCYFCHCAL